MASKAGKGGKRAAGKKTSKSGSRKAGSLRRTASSAGRVVKRAVSGALEKASSKIHKAAKTAAERDEKSKRRKAAGRKELKPRRVARASSPIPDPDVRTPSQTSSHGPFDRRSERDPDKIPGAEKVLNEQFGEEDHFTNKSKDPRIGTRGRTYTP